MVDACHGLISSVKQQPLALPCHSGTDHTIIPYRRRGVRCASSAPCNAWLAMRNHYPEVDDRPLKLDGRGQQRRIFTVQRIVAFLAGLSDERRAEVTTLHGDIYQFGVLTGFGLRAWIDTMTHLNLSISSEAAVYGFDSFDGMPAEDEQYMRKLHKHNSQWLAGGLNTSRIMGSTHWPTLEKQLLRNIGFESSRTKLIKGFYNDSLREGPRLAWRLGMRPALLVDIDCDLYTSSKQALTFMLESGLLVPGTFVYYDDFSIVDWARLPYKEERLAHEEITRDFGIKWRALSTLIFTGPLRNLSWISQYGLDVPTGTRLTPQINKSIIPILLTPLFQMTSCTRCPQPASYTRVEPGLEVSKTE